MIENYYEKYGRNQKRRQTKIICDFCHTVVAEKPHRRAFNATIDYFGYQVIVIPN